MTTGSKKADARVSVDYKLPDNHPAAERLGLWLKGDSSCSELEILCYHSTTDSWLSLAQITLNDSDWQHLEIAASNPIYLYYESVKSFRFVISSQENLFDFGPKQIHLAGLKLINSKVTDQPFVTGEVPSPLFDTWGGPSEQQLMDARPAGVNMHMAPIGFFGEGPAKRTADYASRAVKWAHTAGMIPGIQFYNHPRRMARRQPGPHRP